MTKLDEILAEQWVAVGGNITAVGAKDRVEEHDEKTVRRMAVAVLGKRALAALLRADRSIVACPCCASTAGHGPGCEWAAVVDEAARLA